jgi:predicted nuclease of predicted toxin-antitoxin system
VSGVALEQTLKSLVIDVIWAGDWPEDPGDEEILAHAHKEARILMTLDKDFGEIAIAIARKPGEVTARLDEALANLSE